MSDEQDIYMKQIKYVVTEPEGLHSLPASVLVAKLNNYKSDVTAAFKGNIVNAKSPIGLMSLGAKFGDVILMEIEGADEEEVAGLLSGD